MTGYCADCIKNENCIWKDVTCPEYYCCNRIARNYSLYCSNCKERNTCPDSATTLVCRKKEVQNA